MPTLFWNYFNFFWKWSENDTKSISDWSLIDHWSIPDLF